MKRFFSDESGFVLISQRPRIVTVARAAEKELNPALPVRHVGIVIETPSCAVPHCCFYCAWCGHPILLPNDRIGSPFSNPYARKIDVRSIATVCLHCKHIAGYSMFRACRGYDSRHKLTHSPNTGSTLLLTWMHCVMSTCPSLVPFFLKLEEGVSREDMSPAEWSWDDLTCASGHCIDPIALDLTNQLPLRTPPSSAGLPFAASQ